LRDDTVSADVKAVQPIGHPIIHSTKHGLRWPDMYVPLARADFAEFDPPALLDPDERGVGHRGERTIASVSVIPPCLVGEFIEPDRLQSAAVGVGSSEKKYPVTDVRGTNGGRWNAIPFDTPPARGQV
jgi:hypothetical protein